MSRHWEREVLWVVRDLWSGQVVETAKDYRARQMAETLNLHEHGKPWPRYAVELCAESEDEAVYQTVGAALEAAYPWGYRSEDSEP